MSSIPQSCKALPQIPTILLEFHMQLSVLRQDPYAVLVTTLSIMAIALPLAHHQHILSLLQTVARLAFLVILELAKF
jgi:hypothetical protein